MNITLSFLVSILPRGFMLLSIRNWHYFSYVLDRLSYKLRGL